jgi:hypothetical protein
MRMENNIGVKKCGGSCGMLKAAPAWTDWLHSVCLGKCTAGKQDTAVQTQDRMRLICYEPTNRVCRLAMCIMSTQADTHGLWPGQGIQHKSLVSLKKPVTSANPENAPQASLG